ncbi:MAG: PSD1 and planctomycete cytochrome C domain-containing protein [Pirellulaceae bacterium]|nr:PSD1 and planctomycete cytochrome C domain-containing protein [Pirellulaceae bacterium]
MNSQKHLPSSSTPNLVPQRNTFTYRNKPQPYAFPRGHVMLQSRLLALLISSILSLNALAEESPPQEKQVSPEHAEQMRAGLEVFQQDVRPILIGRCVKCHGQEEVEGDFDLSTREGLLKGGTEGAVVKLGKGKESRLHYLITHQSEPAMPAEGKKLDMRFIEAIARWIDLGAPYDRPLVEQETDPLAWTRRKISPSVRTFWSLQPLSAAAIPTIENAWIRNDIDRFILKQQEVHGVSPKPLANRRLLGRRAFLDLLGLPPTPEQLTSFVEDNSPDAYPRLIASLLKSDHFGERWARHWLDVARFAESAGFEHDTDRPNAFHYRDFVIKAFNQDLPFNQFVRWQIAGDEVAADTPMALMATGFLAAGVFPTQLTEREFESARYDALDDMVATLGTSMLGMTVGCARCHDHKFDPIPQSDYYRLAAAFTKTTRGQVELDLDPQRYQRERAVFDKQHQPFIDRLRAYENRDLKPQFDAFVSAFDKLPEVETPWKTLDFFDLRSGKGAQFEKLGDGSWLVSGENGREDDYHFTVDTQMRNITSLRIDALTHPSLPHNGPGRAQNGNFGLTNLTLKYTPLSDLGGETQKATFVRAQATHEQDSGHLSVKAAIDNGTTTGWAVDGGGIGHDQTAVFDLQEPLDVPGGIRMTIVLQFECNVQHNLGRPRISLSNYPVPVALDAPLGNEHTSAAITQLRSGTKFADLTDTQQDSLWRWFVQRDKTWAELSQAMNDHFKHQPQPHKTTVLVATEGLKPLAHHGDGRGFKDHYEETFFLRRGDATQKQGVASLGFLQALTASDFTPQHWYSPPRADSTTSNQRSALADWITDVEHGAGQLLARVIVNRLWQHHFGQGLVRTPNDFGVQGERPSHPELLDWLALQLIDHEWRLKPIHQLIMTSATYMQQTGFDEQNTTIDPENLLLWRAPYRRLAAEIIRDSMLFVSGTLDHTMYGPGSLDEGMKRRSIYFTVKRSKLIPMLQVLDLPEPLVSVGVRPTTTIAPQALMFMNNPNVRAMARSFADRLMELPATSSTTERIEHAYLASLSRHPTVAEVAEANTFLDNQVASYVADQAKNPNAQALTDFCQILFSLNEFLYLE